MIVEQGMDPADLPDGIAEFSETILSITFHGSAKVTFNKNNPKQFFNKTIKFGGHKKCTQKNVSKKSLADKI